MLQREFFNSYYIEVLLTVIVFLLINGMLFLGVWKAQIFTKKTYKKLSYTFNILAISLGILFYSLFKPHNINQRIVFIPTDITQTNLDSVYSLGFIEQIEHNLMNVYQNKMLVHSIWWTLNTLKDYKNPIEKVEQISKNLPYTRIFSSKLEKHSNRYSFTVSSTEFSKTYQFNTLINFSKTSEKIITDILAIYELSNPKETSNYFIKDYWNAKWDFLNNRYDKIINTYGKHDQKNEHINLLLGQSYLNKTNDIESIENKLNPINKAQFPKEFNKAKATLYTIFSENRTNPDIYLPMIRTFITEQDFEEAEDLINGFLTNFGEQPILRKSHSDIYYYYSFLHPSRFQKHGFQSNLDLIKEALSINPLNEKALSFYANKMDYLTHRTKAEENSLVKYLSNYLSINPFHNQIKLILADVYLKKQKHEQALKIYSEYAKSYPELSSSHYNLGTFYFRIASGIKRGGSYNFLKEGTTYTSIFDLSKSYFNKAISIDNHLNSYLYLGRIAELQDDKDEAIKQYRLRIKNRLTDNDPYYEQALKGLKLIFYNDSNLYKKYLSNEGRAVETTH